MSARNSAVICGAVQTVCRPSSRTSTAAIRPARPSRTKIRLRRGSTDTAETHQLCGDPTAAKGWLLNCLEASAWLIATTLKGVAAGVPLVVKTIQSFVTATALGPVWPERTTVPGFHELS